MADSTTTPATSSATGFGSADQIIGSATGAAASGALASDQLGTASRDQNAALSTLQGIMDSISKMLPPELLDLAPQLAQLAYTGEYSVDDVTAAVQKASATAGVELDPNAMAAQTAALNQYQQVAQGSGFTPIERAGIAQSQNQIQTQNAGANQAIEKNLQEQGQGGVTSSLAGRLITQQGANTASSLAGGNIAATGQERAINAISGEANTGASIAGQKSALDLTKGEQQNTINNYNAGLAQQASLADQAAGNTAASQEQTVNADLAKTNQSNTLANNNLRVNAGNTDFTNELAQEGLEAGVGTTMAGVDTAYGTNAQKAGLTAQTNAASQSAAAAGGGLSSLYNSLGGAAKAAGGSSGSSSGSTSLDTFDPSSATAGSSLGTTSLSDLGYSTGGDIKGPGTGTSDSIPAKLSNGEFVTNAEATATYKPVLKAINDGKEPEVVRSILDKLCPVKKRRSTPIEELAEME